MSRKVAIHGFGRIGRDSFKAIWGQHGEALEVVAIGLAQPGEARVLAHLLQHDSNYGRFDSEVRPGDDGESLIVDGRSIPLVSAVAPSQLPWGRLGVDVVVEASGRLLEDGRAAGHLEAGASKVVLTAPSQDADLSLIRGVNDQDYDPATHHVVSVGSDTTNALAPVLKVLAERFDVKSAMVSAVRAYTNAQKLLDAADPDLRRARAAPTSIVPTSTRAAAAIASVLPEMEGRVSGFAVRVPVSAVSILEVTVHLGEAVTAEEINEAYREAVRNGLGAVMKVSSDPLVSTDFRGDPHSAVVDAPFTMTIGPLAKVSAWYDNEWAYACRVADATRRLSEELA